VEYWSIGKEEIADHLEFKFTITPSLQYYNK
jgi:hypothetical protein